MNDGAWRSAKPLIITGLVLIGVVLLIMLALQVREIIAVLFLGMVIGIALNPTVDFLSQARIPRIASVLFVYALLIGAFAVFSYYAAIEVTNEEFDIELEGLRESWDEFRQDTPLPTSVELEDAVSDWLQRSAGGVVTGAMTFFNGVVFVFTALFTALLFTVTQDRMREVFLLLFPEDQRTRVQEVLKKLAVGLRGFVLGELAAMFTIGIVTYIGLVILGVDFPLVLAFFAFLMELLPMIGPWIAYVPALLIALTDSFWLAVQVSLLYLGIQIFENYVVTPVVHGRGSKIPALLILAALLIGGSLMGLLGALVALPLAVALHILFFELVVPWNERRLETRVEMVESEETVEEEIVEVDEPVETQQAESPGGRG